jgi:DNA-binding response OmpR family regulator
MQNPFHKTTRFPSEEEMFELNFPNAVMTIADFFDREEELRKIQETLESSTRRPVVILGERVIGKTSTLNIVAEWCSKEKGLTVLHMPHTYSRDSFAAEILQGICEAAGTNLRQTGLVSESGQFELPTVSEVVRVAGEQIGKQPQTTIVVCIDEFDSLLSKCDANSADQILDFVLYVVEKTDLPLRFVFTMTQVTEQILGAYASQFLSCSSQVGLIPWSPEQSRQFVEWLLKGRFVFTEESQQLLFNATGGHPYFAKAIFQVLLDLYDKQPDGFVIVPEHVQSAIDASLRLPEVEFTLSNLEKAHFSLQERQLLSRFGRARSTLQREQVSNMGNDFIGIARQLTKRNYLVEQEGNYRLRIGLLGQWFAGTMQQLPFSLPLLEVNAEKGLAFLGEERMNLSPKEFQFLLVLAKRAGTLVSKENELIPSVWGTKEGVTNYAVDAVVSRIRKEIERLGYSGEVYLETKHGVGYILHYARYIPPSNR